MPRIRLDRGQLNRVIKGEARRELRKSARLVLNLARLKAPVDTGRLRASGRLIESSFLGLRPKIAVVFTADYAAAVNDGTRPHIIRPRQAQALRFVIGGRVVFAKVVHHPGTRARPFLDDALRQVAASRGYTYQNG